MGNKEKKKGSSAAILLVLAAVCVLAAAYFGYRIWSYYADYAYDRENYDTLREDVLTVTGGSSETTEDVQADNEDGKTSPQGQADKGGDETSPQVQEVTENAKGTLTEGSVVKVANAKKWGRYTQPAPFSVDWDALAEINGDIIGWVYFTGLPQISYPVLQAEDNSYYVNRTYDLSDSSSKAGSIFMDYRMEPDFSSPYTIIYGHNVRDGSMLSDLDKLTNQDLYDSEPYFWIFTPDGDYKYRIFSIFICERSADVFQKSFESFDDGFFTWEQELKARNIMQSDAEISESDHVVIFSTCVPNSYNRLIVCGRRIG